MKTSVVAIVSFLVVSAVGAAAVGLWLAGASGYDFEPRIPADEGIGESGQDVPDKIEGKTETFDVKPPELMGTWPGFRGAYRENISDDFTELAQSWPEGGPPVLWSQQIGEGHAGAAIYEGRVYLHDYDANGISEVIRCMSLTDGKDIWRFSYRIDIRPTHGVSRTVPAVTDEHLVAMGPKCHVTCLDPKTGQLRWTIGLVKEYGTKIPTWYTSQCPLIDDGNAIIAPCGRADRGGKDVLMMAVNCESGEVAWEAPNPDGWEMTHSSITVLELEDYTRMYVYCGSGGVVGVRASDGKVLWKTDQWRVGTANAPTPVPVGGDRVFFCGGYGAGSAMFQIVAEGDTYAPKELFRKTPEVFGSIQQTPIFYKNHLFGVRTDRQFVCLSLGGQVVWASGAKNRFGKDGGASVIAGDMIYALDDDGLLTLMRATPQSYQPLARAQVLPGHFSWGPMAQADGRLICRDETHMVCLDISKKE